MGLINTYLLATGGQNFYSTYNLASNGILIDIIIEDITPTPPTRPGGAAGGGHGYGKTKYAKEEEKKKKITVIATINNVRYTETKIYTGKKNITTKDIKVDIVESATKPRIIINILKD